MAKNYWYLLEETGTTAGTTIADLQANPSANNGTLQGAGTTTVIPGLFSGNARSFPGGGDNRINVGDVLRRGVDPANPFSLSFFWRRAGTEATANYQYIAGDWDFATDKFMYLRVDADGYLVFGLSDDGVDETTLTSLSTIDDGSWYLITVTFTPGTMRIYINGALEAESAAPLSLYWGSSDFFLGSVIPGTGYGMRGDIDNVEVWAAEALTATEVADIYYSTINTTVLSWSFTTLDVTAPAISNESPTTIDVPVNTDVYFEIEDTETGVDLTTLEVTIEGSLAYDWNGVGVPDDGFQTGFDGPSSAITGPVGGKYTVTIDPTSDFPGSTEINVLIDAADLESPANVITPTHEFTFDTADTDAPIILNQDPFPGETGVLPSDPIEFRLQDVGGSGVDQSTINCTVDGGNAVIGGVINTGGGYTGSVTDIGGNVFDVSVSKTAGWGEGLINVVVDCADNATPPNTLNAPYSFTTVGTAPTITNEQPVPGGVGAPTTNVYFELDDDISGVVLATIQCQINGDNAVINGVINAGGGYGGSVTPDGTGRGFDIDIDPPADFTSGSTVNVDVYCEDASGADLTTSYSFTIGFPNRPFVIDTQCQVAIIGSPTIVPIGATGVEYGLQSLDADVVAIQLGPSASGIDAIYDFVNNLDGTGTFKVDFSPTQINRILSVITIDNVGNVSAESALFNITAPVDEIPGTEFKIRPFEYPHSDTCNRLLDDVPESKMILQAGIVVPYSFNATKFDVKVIEVGRAVTITVHYEGAPGKLEQTEQVVIPTNTEFQVEIQLAEGRNFIRATDGAYQDYVVVTATHYATFLCSAAEEIYNETQIRLDEQNQAIESPLSTRLSEYLLEFTDLLPNVRSQKVFASKLALRSLVPEVSQDRSVRDLATALTLNTPIVERTKNQLEVFEPGIYPMFNHIEHGYGYDFHVWTHNDCSSKWRAFIRYLNNFSAFTLISASETEVVFINDRGETVRHSFDPSAGECSLLDSVLPLLCLGEIPVFLECDVLTTIKICYATYPFDSHITADTPLGERAFFDSGLPFDSGGSLDYDYLDPGDDGWVGLPVIPRFDGGYPLDSWGPGMPATGSLTALPQASLSDGDQFTLNDGDHPAVTFYFDVTGTYIPTGGYDDTNVRVLIFSATTAEEVADAMRAAIEGADKLYITPDDTGAATIYLTHTNNSDNGNQTITENLAAGTLSPVGMSGGGSCVWTEGIVTTPAFLSSADVTCSNLITIDAEFDAYTPIFP